VQERLRLTATIDEPAGAAKRRLRSDSPATGQSADDIRDLRAFNGGISPQRVPRGEFFP